MTTQMSQSVALGIIWSETMWEYSRKMSAKSQRAFLNRFLTCDGQKQLNLHIMPPAWSSQAPSLDWISTDIFLLYWMCLTTTISWCDLHLWKTNSGKCLDTVFWISCLTTACGCSKWWRCRVDHTHQGQGESDCSPAEATTQPSREGGIDGWELLQTRGPGSIPHRRRGKGRKRNAWLMRETGEDRGKT